MFANSSNSSNFVWLVNAKYFEEKKQVSLEFSGPGERINERFSFFPKIFVSLKGIREPFLEILSAYNSNKFVLEELENEIAKITCASFTDLKKISIMLKTSLNITPVLLSPERQFLVEKGFSFFDCFSADLKKQDFIKIPETELEFFSDSFDKTLNHLLHDEESAKKICDSLIISNLTSIPLLEAKEIVGKKEIIAEEFLQNLFFKNSFALPLAKKHLEKFN
ncbi:MAG: hypothetical protein Q7K42_03175, partial [Candidatus Diapherotrites archaeon]|nr:hypothetical protein [Candidatus Diapherotrites archaeon]